MKFLSVPFTICRHRRHFYCRLRPNWSVERIKGIFDNEISFSNVVYFNCFWLLIEKNTAKITRNRTVKKTPGAKGFTSPRTPKSKNSTVKRITLTRKDIRNSLTWYLDFIFISVGSIFKFYTDDRRNDEIPRSQKHRLIKRNFWDPFLEMTWK